MMIFDTPHVLQEENTCWERLAEVEIHNLGCSHEDSNSTVRSIISRETCHLSSRTVIACFVLD
jgi:hypothetical protein